MAGPTPVSALIHAATMVAAGVYLVGRFFPLFTPAALLYIAYTGGFTLFIAATIAMVQIDYKKVLAYSTVSQLGFMMLALGVGGWVAGLFHLITHAFFKALLFLCAGSVYHSVHTYEMPALGGLRKKMPWTAGCMLIGTLAISGVPGFSGFYSKDAILAAAIARVQESPEHFLLFVLPAVGAVLTAFYMFRMWLLVFAGEPRGFPTPAEQAYAEAHDEEHALDHGHAHGHGDDHDRNPAAHAHESDWVMVGPLVALAVFSVIVGWGVFFYVLPNPLTFLGWGTPVLEQMLDYGEPYRAINPMALHDLHFYALGASLLILFVGVGLGLLYYAAAGLPVLRPDAPEGRADRGAVWRDLSLPGPQMVLRRAVLGRAGPALHGVRAALPPDRPGLDRRTCQRLGGLHDFCKATCGDIRHDCRQPPGQPDGQGGLCPRRPEPIDPDRPAPQLPDVIDRRPGRTICRRLRLDPRLIGPWCLVLPPRWLRSGAEREPKAKALGPRIAFGIARPSTHHQGPRTEES